MNARVEIFQQLVRAHMDDRVVTVRPDEGCAEVVAKMASAGASCVVVTDRGGRPAGIVTEHDVSRRVAFHTFDLYSGGTLQNRDLDPSLPVASERVLGAYATYREETTSGLLALATASGGFRYSGLTLDPMDDVIRQTRRVYVLGYRSPAGAPGKYRRIQLKCKRKGVELRHRTGYFGT